MEKMSCYWCKCRTTMKSECLMIAFAVIFVTDMVWCQCGERKRLEGVDGGWGTVLHQIAHWPCDWEKSLKMSRKNSLGCFLFLSFFGWRLNDGGEGGVGLDSHCRAPFLLIAHWCQSSSVFYTFPSMFVRLLMLDFCPPVKKKKGKKKL